MHGGAERRRQNLCRESVVPVDGHDLTNQIHSLPSDVVDPADERADNVSSGFGCEQRLTRRKTKRDIDPDALLAQDGASLDPIARQRQLDDDVPMHLGELAPFAEHFIGGCGYYLSADIAVDDLADP